MADHFTFEGGGVVKDEAVLCCAVLCCVVLCCAVLCCFGLGSRTANFASTVQAKKKSLVMKRLVLFDT